MACPKCGCKVHYQYDGGGDDTYSDSGKERCAACRHVFYAEEAADDGDDADGVLPSSNDQQEFQPTER